MIQDAKLPVAVVDDGELQDFNNTRERNRNAAERQAISDDAWRAAVASLTEIERAPHDEPAVYNDVHGSGCGET